MLFRLGFAVHIHTHFSGRNHMANDNFKIPPEIEQLSQKLIADPKSRVFAQLADAYRKAGLTDEAIETTKKGLEHHPGYATAHLILGRCYLEKQMYALAREEFEGTVKNDPQNLVGYKLLAGTYEKQNMIAEAVKYYQMVLDLDPSDMDLAEKVTALKAKQDDMSTVAQEPEPVSASLLAPVVEKDREEAEPVPVKQEMTPAAEEIQLELNSDEPVKEESVVSAEPVPFPEVLVETAPEPKPFLEKPEDVNFTEEKPALKEEVSETAKAVQETDKEEPPQGKAPEPKAEEKPAAVEDAGKTAAATVTLAEIYVQQGFYEKAIEVYKELISAEPDNGDYKARMDELLIKAFPEEKQDTPAEEKAAPAIPRAEQVIGSSEQTPAAKAETVGGSSSLAGENKGPAPDIFGGMFDKPEQKQAEPKQPEQDDMLAKLSTPEKPSQPISPLPEVKTQLQAIPAPAKEAAVDYSALFSDAPKAPEKQSVGPEPVKPEAESGTEKKPEGENTVSSFQSWLSSLQK
jgi:tetratricopeptide (TPR) repeat protein